MTVENISISVRTNADKAASKLSSLVSAMENVKKAADNMVEGTGDISVSISRAAKKAEKEFEPLSSEMQKTIKDANKYQVLVHKAADASVKMEKAFEKGNEAAAWREREKEINATTQAQKEFLKNQPKVAPKPVSSEIQEFLTNANAIDLLKFRIESLNAEMQKAFQSGDANKAANYRQQILNATAALQKQEEALRGVEEQSKKTEKQHSKFLASIKRIAMYRMLRTVLKEITQGFNEGLKNAYNFSKGINGSLAAALDNLATKSLTMKNQMGAAFGSLLETIMPIVLKVVELIRMAAQAISALFAAFSGGDYLIATDVAQSWDKATGAAKKYRNTILGFDEINRLDDKTGGGGGSSADFTKMFEKGELPAWAKWIADHMKLIKDLAIAVGVAIAAWNFAKAISGLLGVESGFSQLLGIAVAAGGAVLMISGYIDAIKNGLNWENLLKILGGATLLVTGLALAFGKTGAAVGLLVSGISLLSIGIVDWLKKGELTQQSFASIEAGILAVGVAVSLLTGSWIPLLISVIGGLVFAATGGYEQVMGIISNLKGKLKNLIDSTKEYFGNGKLEWQDFAYVAARAILIVVNAIEKLITTIKNVIDWIGRFNTQYQGVKSRLNDIEGHKETYGSVWGEVVRGAEIGAWASGGTMQNDGTLFVAGEAGAEIVSNMGNGRTGVTNVEQMEAAVANGNANVVNAVYAMANMIVKAVNEIDPDITLDGQSMADAMYHYNKQAANRYGAAMVTVN